MKKIVLMLILIISAVMVFNGCEFAKNDNLHNHTYTVTEILPTYNSDGYTLHKCECGNEYKDNYKILLSFTSIDEDGNVISDINIESKVVSKNSTFVGVPVQDNYQLISYLLNNNNLSIGDILTASANIFVVWRYDLSPQKQAFLEITQKLEKLVQISNEYNQEKSISKNAELRALQYIRCANYTGSSWNMVAGNLEADFVDYVQENKGSIDVPSLRTLQNLTSPIGHEQIDFVHMMACLNAVVYSNYSSLQSDLAGWGGDLAQLVGNVKSELNGANENNKTAFQFAKEYFNSSIGGFGSNDVYADLDAINIAYIIKNTGSTLCSAFKDYYLSNTCQSRRTHFVSNVFGDDSWIEESFSSTIKTRVTSNLLIQIWCNQNGISTTDDEEIFTACASVFAEYLINQ